MPQAGRPTYQRNKTVGANLRTALKLLGKPWRKDVDNQNHVQIAFVPVLKVPQVRISSCFMEPFFNILAVDPSLLEADL